MKRAYSFLLRLYPRDYRAMFSKEMRRAFELTAAERCGAFFVARELIGLAEGALVEWLAKITTDKTIRGRALPDLMMMRPPGVPREVHFAGAIVDDDRCSSDI
jgi:hypothetical protein